MTIVRKHRGQFLSPENTEVPLGLAPSGRAHTGPLRPHPVAHAPSPGSDQGIHHARAAMQGVQPGLRADHLTDGPTRLKLACPLTALPVQHLCGMLHSRWMLTGSLVLCCLLSQLASASTCSSCAAALVDILFGSPSRGSLGKHVRLTSRLCSGGWLQQRGYRQLRRRFQGVPHGLVR